MAPLIEANISLCRKNFTLDATLSIPNTGVTAIFGESGSGKTSFLRCVAGLEPQCKGEIKVNGEVWQNKQRFLPAFKRPIGYVFQEANLFAHLTAEQNLQFAIKRATPNVNGLHRAQVVDLLGIDKILNQYPSQLSGGELQRVAIARALLINPSLLLMDEPLASLDQARKQEVLPYIEKLKKEFELPILYVSHTLAEITQLADHIAVLKDGKVVCSGTLTETLSRLDLPFSLGEETGVVIEGKVEEKDEAWHLAKVSIQGESLWVRDSQSHTSGQNSLQLSVGEEIRIRILAKDVSLALHHYEDSSISNILAAEVMDIQDGDYPGSTLVRLKIDQNILVAHITSRSAKNLHLHEGQHLWAQIKSVAIVR